MYDELWSFEYEAVKICPYDKVRDSSPVWLPKGWKNKNSQNIKQNMFSRLKFSVDFISEVKNT